MIFQIVYNIGLALLILTALVVFYCVGHAYYQEFKETPKHKKSTKVFWYLVTTLAGIVLIFAGQYFSQDSDYVQKIQRSWASFEGKTYILPTENVTFGVKPYEVEAEKTE